MKSEIVLRQIEERVNEIFLSDPRFEDFLKLFLFHFKKAY